MFRCDFDLDESAVHGRDMRLVFDRIDDEGVVYINGREAGRSTNWQKPLVINATTLLRAGRNIVAVEVLNRDGPGGLTRPVRLESTAIEGLALKWELAKNVTGVARGWFNHDLSSHSSGIAQASAMIRQAASMLTWYRSEFELPQHDAINRGTFFATIRAHGNGMLYLNGHPLGAAGCRAAAPLLPA